ncbi:Taurine catabolism dioxygenase TauD/TfdA [Penicillium cf. viridicatum]|uniref:Taurine catabolism dioxygenase TauD/TfdA n=1 Tax=Penicillium cf. viridicatum TaxID=2972119 RepID=A0A9W9JFV0_9EURO|nr:Taurine catabolism dioxygenase TauD/TfdA [Penicillium cf. viridicatum]
MSECANLGPAVAQSNGTQIRVLSNSPPGTTFIAMLESPTTAGGDTLVSSSVRAYSSLSPRFRKRLEGLTAIHTNNDGVSQELKHGQQAVMRRGVLQAEHPVVLVRPVTKQKTLYVNPVYTKKIVGFDQEESDCILKFLFGHIAKRQDFSCRIRYEAGTLLVWDQRVTNHSQTLDYSIRDRRRGFRLTPLANKPIPAKIEEDDGEHWEGCRSAYAEKSPFAKWIA